MENSHFSIQIKGFQLLGLKRDNLKDKPRFLLLKYIFLAFPLTFTIFSNSYYCIQNYHNVFALAEAVGILLTGILSFSKMIAFCASKERFFVVIDDLNEIFQQGKKPENIIFNFN